MTPKLKSGTVLVLGLAAIMGAGWFSYRAFVPPRWLHDLAGDISYRSLPDPSALPPRDTREAKPVVQAPHPYICVARLTPFSWDRMIVVPSGGDPRIALNGAEWSKSEAEDYATRMAKDPRYQLIAFIKDNRVVADAMFYTFWGDLSALARPDGFAPDTAAFTAVVKDGTHVLSPAEPFPDVCKGSFEMIELYTAATPNGWKVSIMLEELALPHNVRPVNIGAGDQFKPSFLEISPNNKIPAIVDPEGPDGKPISVFESGAILMYLARKMKSPLLPSDERAFITTMQWVFFQMASVGPMFGQMGHFRKFAKEKIPYAIDRYTDESKRILGVMNTQLGKNEYLAGAAYSIADVATYGWTISADRTFEGLGTWPHVKRWFETVGARPAVQKGLKVPAAST